VSGGSGTAPRICSDTDVVSISFEHCCRVAPQEREVETAKTRADTTNADASAASDARDRAEREIAALQATLQREGEAYEAEFEARISVR